LRIEQLDYDAVLLALARNHRTCAVIKRELSDTQLGRQRQWQGLAKSDPAIARAVERTGAWIAGGRSDTASRSIAAKGPRPAGSG
jgi:hypothetical protein